MKLLNNGFNAIVIIELPPHRLKLERMEAFLALCTYSRKFRPDTTEGLWMEYVGWTIRTHGLLEFFQREEFNKQMAKLGFEQVESTTREQYWFWIRPDDRKWLTWRSYDR